MDKDNKRLSAWYSLHQKSNPEDKVIMVVNNGNGLFEDCYGGCIGIGESGYQFESVVERYPHLSRMPSTPLVKEQATQAHLPSQEAVVEPYEALTGQLSDGSWASIPEIPKKKAGRPKGSKNKLPQEVAKQSKGTLDQPKKGKTLS